jgi:putative nucleotidyltransferase with HDIG domain
MERSAAKADDTQDTTGCAEVREQAATAGAAGRDADVVPLSAGPDLARVLRRTNADLERRTAELQELNAALECEVTEHRRSQAELARTTRALRTLSWVNRTLVRVTDERRLLQDVCDVVVGIGGYVMAWAGYIEHDAEKSIAPAAVSGAENEYLRDLHLGWGDSPEAQGPAGRSVRARRTVVARDIEQDPGFVAKAEAAARGYRSVISLPLLDPEGAVPGILVIYASEPDAFDAQETALLEELVLDLAYGVSGLRVRRERLEVEERLVASHLQLEGMVRDVVEAMGRIVETRDPYTQGHEQRVAELAKRIAVRMGLAQRDVDAVELAGLLHDIGKLCVPAEILTKPGGLSPSEFNLVKEHSSKGYEILKDIAFPWPIADIVLQHHERMDGSGYPRGSKGEDILVLARILAVADVVEAMASHRPYRAALGLDQALAEIASNSAAYDADVVRACLDLYEDGRIDL